MVKNVVDVKSISERLDFLGNNTHKNEGIWRAAYTPEFTKGANFVKAWMKQAGMKVYEDAVGNVFGRIEGEEAGVIMTGSHLDTVRDGGKYDGAAGVIAGIEAVMQMVEKYGQPKKTVEVIGMIEEEGSRFGSAYLGSRFMTGKIDIEGLVEEDADGIKLSDAMTEAGYNPEDFQKAIRNDIEAFIELHIEQGPRLEATKKEIGVLTSIVGLSAHDITIYGRQNHAGTTPMNMRLDPVLAASEFICEMTDFTKKISESAVFTVGKLSVKPGMTNVIAGCVEMGVDFRDGVDGALDDIDNKIHQLAEAMRKEGFRIEIIRRCREEAVRLDRDVVDVIEAAAAELGTDYIRMNSGAGHDSQIIALKIPTGMIFVPSRQGISHSPDEFTSEEDLARGAAVLREALHKLAY